MVFHGFLGFRGVVFHVFFEKTVKKHVYNRILRKKLNRLLNERKIATKRSSKTRKEAPQDQPRRLQRGTSDFGPGSRCAMFGVPGPPKDQRSLKKQPCWLQSRLQDWKDWRMDADSLTRQGAWRIFKANIDPKYRFINNSIGKPEKCI